MSSGVKGWGVVTLSILVLLSTAANLSSRWIIRKKCIQRVFEKKINHMFGWKFTVVVWKLKLLCNLMCLCFVFGFQTRGMCALSAVNGSATAYVRFNGFTRWIWQNFLSTYIITFSGALRRKLVDTVAIAPLVEKTCGKADKGGYF